MAIEVDTLGSRIGNMFKKILVILIFAGIASLTVYYFYRNWTISEGTRTGILYKISKKGRIFKTYEGELMLGNSPMMTKESIWYFSVENKEVYQEMQQFEGKNVKVHYREKEDTFPWQGDTDYLVYDVQLIK
ncbi:MAG: 6-phosphogluconate dehydrogenase [Saprospiraceae bacterium]|nr:6-phosphogluconate dehydrogenase [Saprospiraceae bacterium]